MERLKIVMLGAGSGFTATVAETLDHPALRECTFTLVDIDKKRLKVAEKGVRVPKQKDVVTDNRGRVIGEVTSCAMDTEGYLVGQAYIDERLAEVGTDITIIPHPTREAWEKPYDELEVGDRLVMHNEAKVIRRFMPRR